tara:strand:- start:706 stop:957 length:252 start_codon:yes stop_codon:yes gene_type:complete
MGIQTTTHTSGACRAVTPNDSTDLDLTPPCRAIYVGVGGDISINDIGGETVVFKNTIAGSVIPVQTARINATATTATNLVALY